MAGARAPEWWEADAYRLALPMVVKDLLEPPQPSPPKSQASLQAKAGSLHTQYGFATQAAASASASYVAQNTETTFTQPSEVNGRPRKVTDAPGPWTITQLFMGSVAQATRLSDETVKYRQAMALCTQLTQRTRQQGEFLNWLKVEHGIRDE